MSMKESVFPIGKEKEMLWCWQTIQAESQRKILDASGVLQTVHYLYIIRISIDLDQSNVCRDISIIEPLIKLCVPLPRKLYKRSRRRLRTIDEVEEYFPGFKAFIDCSEQEMIPRPKNKRRRKSYYSGKKKKKKHTVKTQYMVVNTEGLILHKTGGIRKVENMIMMFTKIIIR